MPDKDSPYKLNLSESEREALSLALCGRVRNAVADAEDRNCDLQIWRDQLEGNGVLAQNKQWSNACDLNDPISMEAFFTILAQILGSSNRDPKVAVEAFAKEDEDNAAVIEAWLSRAGAEIDIDSKLYDFGYNACRDPAAVGYVGWLQKTRASRDVGYRESGKSLVISGEERDENKEYTSVAISEEVISESFDVRAVDLRDFFLYPADAVSVTRAKCVAERMYVTAEELLDGVEDYGYDEAAVEELITYRANQTDEDRQNDNDSLGLRPADAGEGFYQIYTCYTRLPMEYGNGFSLPKTQRQQDFLVVLSLERNIVLKIAQSPFKERPYFVGGILQRPGKNIGHSLMGMLEGLQTEANANIQFTIDSMNLTMSPAMFVPKSNAADYNKYKIQPGAMIPCDNPKDPVPIVWDRSPLRDGLAWQQDLRNRSKALVAAEGLGQLQPKVRKQAEIESVNQGASAKFGMFLGCFQRSVIAEVYRRMLLLKLEFGSLDEDGEEFLDEEGESRTLTPQALRGRYRIVASGTSLTHSPETREAISRRKQEIQIEYLTAQTKLPPTYHRLLWHGARELLIDLGERNPEAWIGDEPPQAPEAPQNGAQGQPGASPQGAQAQQGNGISVQPFHGGISNGTGVGA